MAKSKKQKGFSDPLDSVFNIIFSGAKSKPVRIKPRKVTGYNASKELAQGLAEIAANPANYLAGNTLGLVNEITNAATIVEFRYDKIDKGFRRGDEDAGRVRIRAGELPNFLRDPNKYIDSIFEKAKAERAWGSYLQIGRGLDSAALTVWAKQQGFSNKEAVSIGMAASNWVGADQVNEARKAFAQNVVYTALTGRANLASTDPKYLPKDSVRALEKMLVGNNVDFLSKSGELEKVLKSVPGLSSRSDFNDIVSEVRQVYQQKINSGYHPYASGVKVGKDGAGNITKSLEYSNYLTEGTLNRDGYLSMLKENYALRANMYLDGSKDDIEYAKTLAKAQNALEVLNRLKSSNWSGKEGEGNFGGMDTRATYGFLEDNLKRLTSEAKSETNPVKKKELERLQFEFARQLKSAERKIMVTDALMPWGSSTFGNFGRYKNALITQLDYEIQRQRWAVDSFKSPSDFAKRNAASIQLQLLEQKKNSLRTMSGLEWRVFLSDLQGTLATMQSTRDILPNLLKGTFFVSDITGGFAPGEFNNIILKGYKRKSDKELEFGTSLLVLPRGGISDSYAALSSLYYLHPSTILKTLVFSGEGFGYLKYRQRLNLARSWNKDGYADKLFKVLKGSSNADIQKYLSKLFAQGEGGVNVLNHTLFANDFVRFANLLELEKAGLGSEWAYIEKMINRDQNDTLMKLFEGFGAPQRFFQRVKNRYNGVIQGRVNKFFVDNVVRKFFGQKVAASVLAKGYESLALRQIISLAAQEWATGIGAALGGPLGAIAAAALVFLAEGFMERIAKPFIKFFAAMLWFVAVILIGAAAFFVSIIYSAFNPLPQQHIPPTDAIACVSDNPFAGSYQYTSPVNAGDFKNAPADSTCPIIGEPKICTWGAGPGASSYHIARKALDIGTRSISDPVWYAPTNGTISEYRAVNNTCADGSNYGGSMKFTDDKGNVYTLIHIKGLASGRVSKGTPVAIAQGNDELNPGYCWTGPHFHLDVNSGGGYVNAETWYREALKCNIVKGDPSCNG